MRENCTYGSMRGRAYPTRGAPLYSTARSDLQFALCTMANSIIQLELAIYKIGTIGIPDHIREERMAEAGGVERSESVYCDT